jgi:hypothetical protein
MQPCPDEILLLTGELLLREVHDMAEHFSADDVASWEGTVQGNADALHETPVPGVPEDVAARAAEWAGTMQGNPEPPAEVEADTES